MNVILDIDETILQYGGKLDWESIPQIERAKYKTAGKVFILRPHFDEFFSYLFDNCASVNLWTWSDKEYAEEVADIIRRRNPKWKVANIWYDEDVDASIEMYGHNKDLNYIWYKKNTFQPCDTILVDDLPRNTQNSSNIKNGIQIAPFNPLGEKLGKEERKPGKIRTGEYTDLSNDDTLLKVIQVIEKANKDPKLCSEGDLPHPFSAPMKLVGGRRRKTHRRKNRRTTRKYRR